MEWIILDDGTDCVADFFQTNPAALAIPNLRYIRHTGERLTIGAKRNILRNEAKGEFVISMDDDDYYPPDRVKHVVTKLTQHPRVQLAGSSEMYFYFHRLKKIYRFEAMHPHHTTHGPLAWRREYGLSHAYDETVGHAEEPSFLDEYTHPMIQLDSTKTILVLCHRGNTYNKYNMIGTNTKLKETSMKLSHFIRSTAARTLLTNILDQEDIEPADAFKAEAKEDTPSHSE